MLVVLQLAKTSSILQNSVFWTLRDFASSNLDINQSRHRKTKQTITYKKNNHIRTNPKMNQIKFASLIPYIM